VGFQPNAGFIIKLKLSRYWLTTYKQGSELAQFSRYTFHS